MKNPRVLLCSVGTGNVEKLRETLLTPLRKSIEAGDWERVILLPSQETAPNAEILSREIQGTRIDIHPLPQVGLEDNADACFAHFDTVLAALRREYSSAEILADFTRGTKAMSAALVLAAVRHELPVLRYLSGGRRDERGMVVAGTEIISDIHTTVATAQRKLDEAREFMRRGNFAAVLELIPAADSPEAETWPDLLRSQSSMLRSLALYYSAWDRLDYRSAANQPLPDRQDLPPLWQSLHPSADVQAWVRSLAEELPADAKTRAGNLRRLTFDLFASAERRLRDRQFEDAVIRAYRVLELIGQFRLCDQGIHSDDIPAEHPVVQEFERELEKNRSTGLSRLGNGKVVAAREQVARLLKRFMDPLAGKLIQYGNEGVVKASSRNQSALIHGFTATGGSDPEPIRAILDRLLQLLVEDSGENAAGSYLLLARALDLSLEQ